MFIPWLPRMTSDHLDHSYHTVTMFQTDTQTDIGEFPFLDPSSTAYEKKGSDCNMLEFSLL